MMGKVLGWIRSRWSRWWRRPERGTVEGSIGPWGEQVAAAWLARRGLRVLAWRVRTPYGEIDLVAQDGDTVVFVEVKTRRGKAPPDLWEVIRTYQKRRIVRAARYYWTRLRPAGRRCRFDVVVVHHSRAGRPGVRWVRGAWSEDSLDGIP